MSEAPVYNLKTLLNGAQRQASIDLELFTSLVLGDKPKSTLQFNLQSASAAIRVLERALQINPDESVVLRWFNAELPSFGMKTPAELACAGHTQALLAYLESIESGSSG